MKKNNWMLVALPRNEDRRATEDQAVVKGQLRMLKIAHRHAMNLIKLGRYGELEFESRKLAGIARVWQLDKERKQAACDKVVAPPIAKFPTKALAEVK